MKLQKLFLIQLPTAKKKNLEISAFLKYINTKIPTNDFTKKLNILVEESKINNKFRNDYLAMNLHDRDIRWIALAEGRKEGAELTKIETAKNMILQSVGTLEQISSITGLAVEDINKLKEELDCK
jgi:hypothetical protein